MKKNILFLGCGKMGSILAKNLLSQKISASEISIIETSDKNKISKLKYYKNTKDLPKNYQANLVFLAIKPQDSEKILKDFSKAGIFHKNTIFISILAGKKLDFFTKIFGKSAKIIRSMPNLPIQYNQGIFAYLANKNLTKIDIKNLQNIFDNFGTSLELNEEDDFDLITAIFGSGPAYIFLLQEIFVEILKGFNCPEKAASNLTNQLFYGSILMSINSDDFSKLKESVTSKNGTTAAALDVLEKNNALKNIFKKAIDAAITRSKELS
jgi:pyrroline-5-carboxylate reductase